MDEPERNVEAHTEDKKRNEVEELGKPENREALRRGKQNGRRTREPRPKEADEAKSQESGTVSLGDKRGDVSHNGHGIEE